MLASCAPTTALRQDGRAIQLKSMGLDVTGSMSPWSCQFRRAPTRQVTEPLKPRAVESHRSCQFFRVNTASSERGVAAEQALPRALRGMSGGRPAVSHRSVVPLDWLGDTYGLADEVIGDPARAAESGTPA